MEGGAVGGLGATVLRLRAALSDVVDALGGADADGALDVGLAARQVSGAAIVAEQAALLRLVEAYPDPPVGPPRSPADRVADGCAEAAAAFGVSWGTARSRLSRAEELAAVPALRAALLGGEVDWSAVRTLLERTAGLTPADRAAAAEQVLGRHRATPGGLSAGAWSRLVGRTVLGIDPDAAARRVAYARVERTAWHTVVDDATGLIGLRGPIADTLRAFAEVDAAARAAAADPDETRTLVQLRFDLARDRLAGLPVEIVEIADPPAPTAPTAPSRTAPSRTAPRRAAPSRRATPGARAGAGGPPPAVGTPS